MPSRTVGDVDPAPGRIFWLPSNAETQAIPDIEVGRLEHPVLILTSGSTRCLSTDRNIQVLIITSFGKQLLEDKFPNAARQRQQRARYIPIGRNSKWSTPHPDTGVLLELDITGDPPAPGKDRQSYICLQNPSQVAKHHLRPLFDGTARLTTKSLVQVVDMHNEMNCTATITLPVQTITPPAKRKTPPAQMSHPVQKITPPAKKETRPAQITPPAQRKTPPAQVSPLAQTTTPPPKRKTPLSVISHPAQKITPLAKKKTHPAQVTPPSQITPPAQRKTPPAPVPPPAQTITHPAQRKIPLAQIPLLTQTITPPAQRITPLAQISTSAQRIAQKIAPPPVQMVSLTAQSILPRPPCGCHSGSAAHCNLPASAQYYVHIPPSQYSREWTGCPYAETMSRYREHSPPPKQRQCNKPQPAEGARTSGTHTKDGESPFSISMVSVILVELRFGFKAVFGR